jgi:hypothetical protein
MSGSLLFVTLGATIVLATSGALADANIPKLNVEPSCRAAAKMGDSMNARFQQCMNDENSARTELEQKWRQFPQRSMPSCIGTAQIGSASYVQLLSCLELSQEADAIRKSSTTGQGR